MSVQMFFNAYVEAALWSSTDETNENGGEPLDKNYSELDLTEQCQGKMLEDCQKFYDAHSIKWLDDAGAGHDFWLTRNGYGEGFSSRKPSVYGEHAKELYEAAKAFSAVYLYVTDSGEIDCG